MLSVPSPWISRMGKRTLRPIRNSCRYLKSRADLVRIYGSRFAESKRERRSSEIALGWDDEESFVVDIDANGRIVELSLLQPE